jgi:hypothetical protein
MSIERITAELELLRGWFPSLDYLEQGHWVRLPGNRIPAEVWSADLVEVCFQIPAGLPGQAPYAFHARPRLTLADGREPNNYTWPTTTGFGGEWGTFSWALESWAPAAEPTKGSNMLDFARSIANRFREGA